MFLSQHDYRLLAVVIVFAAIPVFLFQSKDPHVQMLGAEEVPPYTSRRDINAPARGVGGGTYPLGEHVPHVPIPRNPHERVPAHSLLNQTAVQAAAKSFGCLACHQGIEKMHESETVNLGCVDCHGGNANALTKEAAHVHPCYPEKWPTAGNPQKTFALLNQEHAAFVRFINPGDFRVAHVSCGTTGCHTKEVDTNRKSMMAHSAMVPGSALYNNGAVPNKLYRYGEVYGPDGTPQRVFSSPRATIEDVQKRGILPWLDPLPDFRVTQPDFRFRVLEVNNNATSARGAGTDFRVDAVFINLVKTKLNDPTMAFLGMNNNPGDYRSSGCTSCHVLYANDRNPDHSAHIAHFGNRGFTATSDPMIKRNEPGHPIRHSLTRRIPTSQCMTCHFHQGSGALGNYLGYVWWDYETDAEHIYHEFGAPEPGGTLAGGFSPERHDLAPTVNAKVKGNKFADFHNNTWLYQAVYKRDRKGYLVDQKGNRVDENDPNWHQLAIHMRDIHLEKGLHCIDCHFEQDVHGNGRLYGAMVDQVEIACKDCHGTVQERANLITSNPSGGNHLQVGRTSFGTKRFVQRDGKIYQRSMINEDLEWEVVQVKDVVTPGHPHYNETAAYAKTIQKDGKTWGDVPEDDGTGCDLAHQGSSMTCYSCHSSWNTSCGGCHLSAQTNRLASNLHYDGEFSKNLAYYNPQALRADAFLLGKNGTVQGNKVSPVRAASGVIVSAADGNRATVVHQHVTFSAEGHSGHAFSPNPPHTVGGKGMTRMCSDCHISDLNNNNAVMAQVLGIGARSYDFVGRYAYVANGEKGISAIQVTNNQDFPNPVIGSDYQRIVYPAEYKQHYEANGGALTTAIRHRSKNAQSIVHVGEWLLVADGPGGFRVFDIANIHNKDVANRIVTAGLSPLGQGQDVRTQRATSVALASTLPVDPTRSSRPENEEQALHSLFGYAYVTDYYEGLILIGIASLIDGNPDNNNLSRAVTFNPDGLLCGAIRVKIWGEHAYVLTEQNGLFVVDISNPKCPVIVRHMTAPEINHPKSIDFQFRYAFVCDEQGLKVLDITDPEGAHVVSVVPMRDARDVWVQKTYAYVAAGCDGLAIVDIETPTYPGELTYFNEGGCINDATAITTGMEGNSWFAFLADGQNGLRVIQLLSPSNGSQVKGFSPEMQPRLIATCQTEGPCVAISEGIARDRYVDYAGNQIGVFGRRGSRPFNREEMRKMYLRDGEVYTVTDHPMTQPVGPNFKTVPQQFKSATASRDLEIPVQISVPRKTR